MIKKSVALWLPKIRELEKPESASEGEDFNPINPVPLSYETRIQTAQILTEVQEYDVRDVIMFI